MKHTLITLFAVAATASLSSAATYVTTIGGLDYTIVEADPFATGGTAGNTTAVGGVFFSGGGESATTWRNRTVSPFNTGYENVAGATNRIYDHTSFAPELVTSVTGLAAGTYEVFAVYIYANDGGDIAGIRANLGDSVGNAGTVTLGSSTVAAQVSETANDDWAVGLGSVGTTGAGVTSFAVNIDDNEPGNTGASAMRADYIGVAYRAVAPIPEPSSTALLGLGGLALILRRRK